MKRLLLLLAAMAAALVLAPGASAAVGVTYVVNDPGSANDATAQSACSTPGAAGCTLPAAITDSNASTGVADTITFSGAGTAPGPFATPLPQVTDPVTIDGGGNTTVSFASAATGVLLDIEADNSLVKSIVLTGGDAGAVVANLGGSADQLNAVTVQNSPGTAIRLAGSSERADGVALSSVGTGIRVDGDTATISAPSIVNVAANGIVAAANSVNITSPEISGAGGEGISLLGSNATVAGGHIHGNGGNGVGISGQNDAVSSVTFYANGGKPIALAGGANGGVQPPANLRIGPRRADGSLPLTGTASTGTLELWSGDPSGASAPTMAATFRVAGAFTYNFPSEPAPGSVFAASLTGDGLGTSEFELVRVPDDVSSPDITFARALDTNNVRVDFTEPIDPNSVQPGDFHLTMAGADRAVSGVTVAPDGRSLTLASGGFGWKAGEAGTLDVTAAGAVTDAAGNAMLTTPHLRVAAAPGDFIAPLGGSLALAPRSMCLTHGRNCRHPGLTIRFTSTEAGKAMMVIKRGDVTLGKRLYGNIVAGTNTLKFNGRLGARKLRAGRYRLLMYVQDQVGNVTDNPPIALFSVRRVAK